MCSAPVPHQGVSADAQGYFKLHQKKRNLSDERGVINMYPTDHGGS